jgi:TusA-related sulfurtransferase
VAAHTLDITSLRCPMTWVKTKLALEVTCPEGEALENVPRSAREAGHEVSVSGTTVRIVRR